VAVLAEAHFLLHGWLRSGNCGRPRRSGILKRSLALLRENMRFRGAAPMPASLISNCWFLEQRGLSYHRRSQADAMAERECSTHHPSGVP